jgi:hypothetical protein
MKANYYNTTGLSGSVLVEYGNKVLAQDETIERFFRARPGQSFTPCDVWGCVATGTPLTSVRRSMNTLTKRGVLVKTEAKKIGLYKHPNHLWTLNTEMV